MQTLTSSGINGEEIFVLIEVANRGSMPVTIQQVALSFYKNRWQFFLKKSDKRYVVPIPEFTERLPKVLDPGAVWHGKVIQDELEDQAEKGGLIFEVLNSHDIDTRQRLKI